MGRKGLTALGLACVTAVFTAAVPAAAQDVRIISVDGQVVRDGRAGPVKVLPGQVVSLTADEVFNDRGQQEFSYRPIEDFTWRADDVPGDVCDPLRDCRSESNFEATDYGVNFYVPRNAPNRIEIVVNSKYGAGEDRILLINEGREPAARAGYDYGLTSYGWWTSVDGERVFVPYSYEDGWEPYTHGYWYWTSFGWTWYSYDPWGDVTDHYGHWRHHGAYGWVWLPDPTWIWRAAVVSFFYGDGWVGWWPYDGGWSHGYRHGYAQGYDDGYWMGYWAGRRVGDYPGRRVRPGATVVAYRDFYVPGDRNPRPPARADRGGGGRMYDIASKRITDRTLVERRFTDAVREGGVGAMPGGGTSLAASRQFIAQKAGVMASETALKPTRASLGSTQRSGFVPVKPEYQAPDTYRVVSERVRTTLGAASGTRAKGVAVPLGHGIDRPALAGGSLRPERGVAPAPVFKTADRTQVQTWAPRARDVGGVRPGAARPEGADVRSQIQPRTLDAVRDAGTVRPVQERTVQQVEAQPTFERRPSTVETRVDNRVETRVETRGVPQQREVERDRFERPEIDPNVGLPVDRTVRPDDRIRPDRETVSPTRQQYVPQPSRQQVAPQETRQQYVPQPSRQQAVPQPSRPQPEVRAPQPDARREVPREVYRPRDEDRPSRPSFGGGTPSGGSSAPPAYTPPKPRFSPAPAPSRSGGGQRRPR